MNDCGYFLETKFSPNLMDVPPMIFTGNPLIIKPGMVFFIHAHDFDGKYDLISNEFR